MPLRTCAALNCLNSSNDTVKKRFFKFPMNQRCAKQWVIACRREDLLKKLDSVCQSYSTYFICEDHFEDAMFNSIERCRLRSNTAMPTIFPNFSPEIAISKCVADKSNEHLSVQENITVKEEPLTDPLKSETEVTASPQWINCDSNDDFYVSNSAEYDAMEFLPEDPIGNSYKDMVCSPIAISDDEETSTFQGNGQKNVDCSSVSSHYDSSVDLTGSNDFFPMGSTNRLKTKGLIVDSEHDVVECRTCLVPLAPVRGAPLYEKCHPKKTIKEMISLCVPQMASNLADGDVICKNCLKRVRQCVNFIEDCLTVENTLKERGTSSEIEFVEVPHEEDASSEKLERASSGSERTENSQPVSNSDTAKLCWETYKCTLCWRGYKTEYMLEDHRRKIHNIEREGGYNCHVCHLHFVKLIELEKHWITHTIYCSICKKRFMENQICGHIKITKTTQDTSSRGTEIITDISDDEEHCKIPLQKALYNCYKCERVIQSESKYISHMKLHGNPEKLFFCDKCPKSYGNFKVLRYHQMMSHEKVKSSCKYCSQVIWNFNMPSHYRTRHANVKMTFCRVCDEAFDNCREYKSHLRTHIAMGHVSAPTKKRQTKTPKNSDKPVQGATPEDETQPVKCYICFLRFAKQDLDEHLRSHQ